MIILGIDPGTAMLGYGLIERAGPRLRAIDYGVITTPSDMPLPERLAVDPPGPDRSHRSPRTGADGRGAALLHQERPDGICRRARRAAWSCSPRRSTELDVREATPNEVKVATAGHGAAGKEQVQRMVQAVLGLPEIPEPDDAADALAIAICVAQPRAIDQPHPDGRDGPFGDPAALRALTPFEKAVRDALRKERDAGRGARPAGRPSPERRPPRAEGDLVIASLEGTVGAVFADSMILEVGGIGYRVFAAPAVLASTPVGQRLRAVHPPRRSRGSPGPVRIPLPGGTRLLRPAAHGHRRRAQSGAWDRRVSRGRRPPDCDSVRRPGAADRGARRRQEARRSRRAWNSRRRSRPPAFRPVSRPRRCGRIGSRGGSAGARLFRGRSASGVARGLDRSERGLGPGRSSQGGPADSAPRLGDAGPV